MIRFLIGAAIVIVVTILVITSFLGVNDFKNCAGSPSNLNGCEKADVVIAVSGGDTTGRAQHAIDMYNGGWADKIIFSGAAFDKTGPSNADVMRQQAINQDVPADAIIIERDSSNTQENASNTIDILQSQSVNSAIVVTSSYHQKRTLTEFQRQAPDIDFRSSPSVSDRQWSVWWWTTPHGWYLAVSEIVKIVIINFSGSGGRV